MASALHNMVLLAKMVLLELRYGKIVLCKLANHHWKNVLCQINNTQRIKIRFDGIPSMYKFEILILICRCS